MVQTEKWIRIKIKLYNLCTRPMAHANMKLSHSQAKKTQDGADLHFLSPQPDTSLHCRETTDMVHSAVCLFTSQLSLVLTVSTHRGMARLSWPGKRNQTNYKHQCWPILLTLWPFALPNTCPATWCESGLVPDGIGGVLLRSNTGSGPDDDVISRKYCTLLLQSINQPINQSFISIRQIMSVYNKYKKNNIVKQG